MEPEDVNPFASEQGSQPAEKREKPWMWIVRAAAIFVAAMLFCAFVARPRYVMGVSMQNTFQNNDYLIVWELNYHPQRGDVVTADNQNSLNKDLIKRVIAVGGDHIVVKNGSVILNGKKLTEPYIKEQQWGGGDVDLTVPAHHVFLMGDNRNNSGDSRIIGAVDCSHIQGKVVLRLFPFDKIRTF